MVCPKCGSQNVAVQAVAENQRRGCLSTALIIILLFIPVIGWIGVFMILRGKKQKTVSYALCQNCGHRWDVNNTKSVTIQYQEGTQQPDQQYSDYQ